jgi:hypothetical protein
MISSSLFSSPFHDSSNDPEAFGSFTSCQGPPAKPHTSPVAKFRRQIASAFSPKRTKYNLESWKSEPFDTEIVILDFVPEKRSTAERASSAPPAALNLPGPPTPPDGSDHFGPFDTDIVIMDFIADDTPKRAEPSQKLRHFSSRATIADPSRCASQTSHTSSTACLLEDSLSFRTMTPDSFRPTTAGGGSEDPLKRTGEPEARGCQCRCGWVQCRFASVSLCRCSCSCKDCRCKARKRSNKFLRMLESR